MGKSFYFLLSSTQHVEAGSYDIQSSGGAGYLLEYGEESYLAIAVYFSEADGLAVQGKLSETKLLTVNIDRLYFKGCREKQRATLYESALECLYGCMQALGWEIARLDDGGTQQSALGTLEILLRQLRYLSAVYQGAFQEYTTACQFFSEYLSAILSDIIYAKALRYLLCDMAAGYIRLASNFSI